MSFFRLLQTSAARHWAIAPVLFGVVICANIGAAADPAPEKPLPAEEVTLKTKDGVVLVATHYPSKLGKNAVPVVLLHASKGSRTDLVELALVLQRHGHAVIVPDLRGHGDSTRNRLGDRTMDLKPADYQAMVAEDLETVKRFLMTKNNAGELNIDKLCLVGIEMGASVALNWAARDWSWPMLNTGKQGQDVKALVLVSPEWSFKGLRITEAVAHPNVHSDLSILIISGKGNGKSLAETRRLHAAFEKYHPAVPPEFEAERQMLWLRTPQTSLQGTRLLNEKSLHVDEMITKFIELRLTKKQMPWTDRKSPLE